MTTSVITCSETVLAPVGSDLFVIGTFSGTGGSGAQLNVGNFNNVTIANNTANTPSFQLHPVVSTNASTNTSGSLSYAIGNASTGDLITFTPAVGPAITVTGPITIANNITVVGPGAKSNR